ncbi:MAG: 2-oxo acid dehydrogenase subunit E2 [Actinobacteria bacterium]|nr:2-oxo acid dehydrogenase subunit E2 [Actinomycetota bacterium]
MYEVIMPKLGLTMETGVIEKWHKKEGDAVESGEVLFEVMTDKVSLEVEAYNSGIVRKILRKEGEEVPVTEVIAYIGEADEVVPSAGEAASAADTEKPAEAAKPQAEEKETAQPVQKQPESDTLSVKISPLARNIAFSKGIDITKIKGTGPGGRIVKEDVENYVQQESEPQSQRIKISPLARSLAKEHGIDYTKAAIKGTGPGGRIVKEDIIAYAESAKSKPQAASAVSIPMQAAKVKSSTPLKGIRKVIAERMVYAKQTIPHIIPTSVMDATALVSLRDRIKDRVKALHGANITYTDFITKACAIALSEHPVINASLIDNDHIIYQDINIGIGVSIEAGLIVPTIYGAASLSLFDIAKKRADLIEKAKASKLSMEEISNGTFTISNLGMLGVRNFTAIINPPQGAILMVGEIYKAPAVVDDKIEIRQQMEISIAVDHRIIDGADAAKFLLRLKELIENPEILLI